jgi:glycosyltransferase involved in cell wall biosynthesis
VTQYLYLTADTPGAPTGGGRVTADELAALQGLGPTLLVRPVEGVTDPLDQDRSALRFMEEQAPGLDLAGVRLAHVYAGCFTQCCAWLRGLGVPVTYTVAAHDVHASRKAHEELGVPFAYPHLTELKLFHDYAGGYLDHSDVVIVPGTAPKQTIRSQRETFGVPEGRLKIIPHGVDRPTRLCNHARKEFVVGYLGATGPDKGLADLFDAFASASLPSARLLLCGRDCPAFAPLMLHRLKGCSQAIGWQEDIADFFGRVTLYVQPSRTEGFGIPVAESLAHGVPVICSDGAGACDLVGPECRYAAGDVPALADLIREMHADWTESVSAGRTCRWFDPRYMGGVAAATYEGYCRQRIRQEYQDLWKEVRR